MAGIAETLGAAGQIQGASTTWLQAFDASLNVIASAAGFGTGLSVFNTIMGILYPPAGSSQPSLQDLLNKFKEFSQMVSDELAKIDKRVAGGQVQNWASDLEKVLLGPEGSLSIIDEINTWKNNPGLPLPDNFDPSPSQCQIWARAAVTQTIGYPAAPPPSTPPTPYWYLPEGDLPLFKPDNPWIYWGTTTMFNQPLMGSLGPDLGLDFNQYENNLLAGGGENLPLPQFDLSALHFTNDFRPTGVPGVPPNNAFNPMWILQQCLAAVNYYFIICGAVLKNFPNDGSTANDFVGNTPTSPNFLGVLSWYHDQIRAGIVCIAPPFPLDLLPFGPGPGKGGLVAASADKGVSAWSAPCAIIGLEGLSYSEVSKAATNAPPSKWKRPFGAQCSYNCFVAGLGGAKPSVDSYPDYVFPTPGKLIYDPFTAILPISAGLEWYNGFYCKYLVACLWRAKLVYNGMGLDDMWRTINKLYAMFGQPPRPEPCFGDWSLREVFRMLGAANNDTFPLPAQQHDSNAQKSKFTVRAFLQFMNGAPPTPKTPLTSLRAALQGV